MHYTIEPYNPIWPTLFEEFKRKLTPILGENENLTTIHHIGSTSVPGLSAKPVIDMMPAVGSISKVDELEHRFAEIGFEWRGEFGIAGRRYLTFDDPGTGKRVCQVHIFEASSSEIEKHLAFRDLMRSDSAKRLQYETLKLDLFKKFPHDKDAYHFGKEPFILEVTKEALRVRFATPQKSRQ